MTLARILSPDIALAVILLLGGAAPEPAEVDVKETSLGGIRKLIIKSLTPSPDGKRLAYANSSGKEIQLVTDGKADPTPYQGIAERGIVFSPDSKHVAFLAQSGPTWVVVMDGTAGGPYATYAKGSLAFSTDSAHWLVTADEGGQRLLLLDGKAGKAYSDVAHPRFSADGKHTAYAARDGEQWMAVIDGQESEKYETLLDQSVFISPDSSKIAYAGRLNGKWRVVVREVTPKGDATQPTGPEYEAVAPGTLLFSADGSHCACAVSHEGLWGVLDNGKESKGGYARIPDASVAISPDGKSLSFVAERGGKMFAVTDGVEGAPFDSIEVPLVYSPDGKHLAYIANNAVDARDTANAKTPREWTVVLDGKSGGKFDKVLSKPVFSADGSRVAFVAVHGRENVAVVDGKDGAAFDEIVQPPLFSADGKRVGYAGRRGSQQFAVIDGTEGEPFDAVGRLAFSPDGKHFAYGAQANNEVHIVFDTASTRAYPGLVRGAALVFESPIALNTLAYRGNELMSVHVELKEK